MSLLSSCSPSLSLACLCLICSISAWLLGLLSYSYLQQQRVDSISSVYTPFCGQTTHKTCLTYFEPFDVFASPPMSAQGSTWDPFCSRVQKSSYMETQQSSLSGPLQWLCLRFDGSALPSLNNNKSLTSSPILHLVMSEYLENVIIL